MYAKFGPAGAAESFKKMGYKKSVQLPEYPGNTVPAIDGRVIER